MTKYSAQDRLALEIRFGVGSGAPAQVQPHPRVVRELTYCGLQGRGILVNAACPGWVRTEMGGANADRSVEEGADTIVWLASDAPASLSGKFFRDRAEIPW